MNAIWKTRLLRKWPRLLFLLISAAGVICALRWERHRVVRLDDGTAKYLSGRQFVEGTTYDGFGRRLGQLYDVYSLSPLAASERDCKT